MATKQEALKALLATYTKLQKLYTENPEFQEDATAEDKALYEKVGAMYRTLQKNTNSEDPVLEQLRKTFQDALEQWESLSNGLDWKALARLQADENDTLLVGTLINTQAREVMAAADSLWKALCPQNSNNIYASELSALQEIKAKIDTQFSILRRFFNFQKENKLAEKDAQTVISIVGSLEDKGDALLARKHYLEAVLSKNSASAVGDAMLLYGDANLAITDAAEISLDDNAMQKELQEINEQLACKTAYQTNLLKLVTSQTVRIDYVDKVTTDNGVEIDAKIVYNQEFDTYVVQCNHKAKEALIAHEMQHLIQVQRGKLLFLKDGSRTFNLLYDLTDEQEAYQIQFLTNPRTIPGYPSTIKTYNDLTLSNIKGFSAVYTNLPEQDYSINNTLDDILKHPAAAQYKADLEKKYPDELKRYGSTALKDCIDVFFKKDVMYKK